MGAVGGSAIGQSSDAPNARNPPTAEVPMRGKSMDLRRDGRSMDVPREQVMQPKQPLQMLESKLDIWLRLLCGCFTWITRWATSCRWKRGGHNRAKHSLGCVWSVMSMERSSGFS